MIDGDAKNVAQESKIQPEIKGHNWENYKITK
jgi:hypothetical protein